MHCVITIRKMDSSMEVIKMLHAFKGIYHNRRNKFGHTALHNGKYVINMIMKKVGSQGRAKRGSEELELSSESYVGS